MYLIPQRFIAWRARRIKDPVARLRYLRESTAIRLTLLPGRTWKAVALMAALSCFFLPRFKASNANNVPVVPAAKHVAASPDAGRDVWLVEHTGSFETYSNGLRIDDRYAVTNRPRQSFPVFRQFASQFTPQDFRSDPVGIVFHTTESDQASFEEAQNAALKRIGHEVLSYVRANRSYHFLIDRFGQVFRIVEESDIANHAGSSVWADGDDIYVNLNASFLGVAFETQTRAGELASANPAQIHAARVLTEMLRRKYHIQPGNCVTHAQVSVNPGNMLVGYHTDWAGNFPFQEIGLADNYTAPIAAILVFGFDYNQIFVHATGWRLWRGLSLAEDRLRAAAESRGLSLSLYRALLRKRYKDIITTLDPEKDQSTEVRHGI